jgi:hypothetical protein
MKIRNREEKESSVFSKMNGTSLNPSKGSQRNLMSIGGNTKERYSYRFLVKIDSRKKNVSNRFHKSQSESFFAHSIVLYPIKKRTDFYASKSRVKKHYLAKIDDEWIFYLCFMRPSSCFT